MKGKRNVYDCPNGHRTVTVDSDEGTTPAAMLCKERRCKELAWSNWYAGWCQLLTPTHEWYKPDADTFAKLDRATRQHVRQGGLIVRRIRLRAAIKTVDAQEAKPCAD